MTSLLAVPNLGTCDPYLPKMGETLKICAAGWSKQEKNRCIKWDMVVKGHNKKPEKDDL